MMKPLWEPVPTSSHERLRKLSLKRKGQAREEDHVTVVALQGVQISLQEVSPLHLPEGRRVGGAGDLA